MPVANTSPVHGAHPAGACDDVSWVAPRDLLHPARLDLAVKYRYFMSLRAGEPDPAATRLYEQHIARRTGGYEDAKRHLADYHEAARRLLASIEASGFDATQAIPIGPNGLPADGAHRLAACLALDHPIAIRRSPSEGPSWGFEWFNARAFSSDDVDGVLRTYAHLSNSIAVFVFWGPTLERWPTLMDRLASHGRVVGWRDLALDPSDIPPVVHDVYAYRLGPATSDRIEAKARALVRGRPQIRAVIVDAGRHGAESGLDTWSAHIKADLRSLAGRGPADFFETVHGADTLDESRYLVDLLLNANSLRQLAARRGRQERPQFIAWLVDYRAALARHGVSQHQACVVGSAVLEAVGLREATDIDCVVADAARRPRFHNGVTALAAGVDLVTAGYHRRADGGAVVTDDRVIADPSRHFLCRGLKFANPELVIDRKRQHARPKDLADVALWDARTTGDQPSASGAPILFWDRTPVDVVRQAAWLATAAKLRLGNIQAVVAGPPHIPALFPVPCIEGPPAPEDLPACVVADPDPLATLETIGADSEQLLAADAVRQGWPEHSGQAIRRLGALARTACWIEEWFVALRPAAVVILPSDADSAGLLLEAIARRRAVPIARCLDDVDALLDGAAHHASRETRPPDVVCRAANEWTALLRAVRAADTAGAAARRECAVELTVLRAAVSVVTAAASGRPIWIWGAGAAGVAAAGWLAGLGVPVRGAVDSDPAKHGAGLSGTIAVHPPDTVLAHLDRAPRAQTPLVVVASIHADAIMKQLHDRGATDGHVVVAPSAALPPVR